MSYRALLLLSLLPWLSACPLHESESRPPLSNPPVIDLVVGDMGYQVTEKGSTWLLKQPKLVLYFDALKTALGDPNACPPPDLILGAPPHAGIEGGFALGRPVDVEIDRGDLYVVDRNGPVKRLYIWRDYRNLIDHAEPDVTLLTDALPYSPWELFLAEDCLFVVDAHYYGLLAWKNAPSIQTDDLPDQVIAPPIGGALMSAALDEHGNLYTAWIGGYVDVYYDFMNEYLDDVAPVRDVRLQGASFMDSPMPVWKLLVANNVLYTHTHSSSSTLYAFSPADALVDFQPPNAVITPTLGKLEHPFSMAVAGNTLYVGNMHSENIGVCGFRPADALATGQSPNVILDYANSSMGPCSNLSVEENILFATSSVRPVCDKQFDENMNVGDVHVFGHADQIRDGDCADVIIMGGFDFLVPLSIDAAVVPED